jgi:hypothetical protein
MFPVPQAEIHIERVKIITTEEIRGNLQRLESDTKTSIQGLLRKLEEIVGGGDTLRVVSALTS